MPTLANNELCVGCTACVLKCPKKCLAMTYDNAGFAYPQMINREQCVECNLCEKVCPVLNPNEIEQGSTKAIAAFSIDNMIREESSSGGIFTELALQVLNNKGVVYGAAYNNEWSVEHIGVNKKENLYQLRGAKYVESRLKNAFSEIEIYLQNKQQVLFSGTPCQVAGLKSYLQKDYSNLLCVDFVCHGIPSPLAWKKYIDERKRVDNETSKPSMISQRSKETGWSRYSYSCVMEYPDGKKYSSLSSDDLYMKLFCNDYISRKSCKKCQFKGYDRISDITLGDFWGIWDIEPEMDDGKGTSLVLIHTEKGRKVFSNLNNRVKYKETTLEAASAENKSLLYSSAEKLEREKVLEEIKNDNYFKLYDLFPTNVSITLPMWKRVVTKIKGVIFRHDK